MNKIETQVINLLDSTRTPFEVIQDFSVLWLSRKPLTSMLERNLVHYAVYEIASMLGNGLPNNGDAIVAELERYYTANEQVDSTKILLQFIHSVKEYVNSTDYFTDLL